MSHLCAPLLVLMQLCQAAWIVGVRAPAQAEVEAALTVFDERELPGCISGMPQLVLAALVKGLGSAAQGLAVRSACARCIGNAVAALVKHGAVAEVAAAQAAQAAQPLVGCSSSSPITPRAASGSRAEPRCGGSAAAAAPAAAATPSPTPRSALLGASLEELAAEPGLLDNLLRCMLPDKALEAARKAGGPRPSLAQAEELAAAAARAVAMLLRVRCSARLHMRAPRMHLVLQCFFVVKLHAAHFQAHTT